MRAWVALRLKRWALPGLQERSFFSKKPTKLTREEKMLQVIRKDARTLRSTELQPNSIMLGGRVRAARGGPVRGVLRQNTGKNSVRNRISGE